MNERLRDRLKEALHHGGDTHTIEDVLDGIRAGRYQGWGTDEAAIVTEIVEYPRCKALHYWLVAGDLDACLALQFEIEKFAAANGCDRVTATGRHGWNRILSRRGWRATWTAYTKAIPSAVE